MQQLAQEAEAAKAAVAVMESFVNLNEMIYDIFKRSNAQEHQNVLKKSNDHLKLLLAHIKAQSKATRTGAQALALTYKMAYTH